MSVSSAELLRQIKSRIEEIDPSEVKELIGEGVAIVDVRGSEEVATGHLPRRRASPGVIWSRGSRARCAIAPPR